MMKISRVNRLSYQAVIATLVLGEPITSLIMPLLKDFMKFFPLMLSVSLSALLSLGGQLLAAGPGKTVTYYELLGVARIDAKDDLIKKAWQQKLREWHPDKWQKMVGRAECMIDALDSSYNEIKGVVEREKYNNTPAFSKWKKDTAGAVKRAWYVQISRAYNKEMEKAYSKLIVDWDVDTWTKTVFGATETAPDGNKLLTKGIVEKLALVFEECGPIKPNAYDILGVVPTSTDAQIKAAYAQLLVVENRAQWNIYLTLARENLKEVEEITRLLMTAYAALKNVNKRAAYNRNSITVNMSPRAVALGAKLSAPKQAKPLAGNSAGAAGAAAPQGPASTEIPPSNDVDNSQGKRTNNLPQARYIGNKTILAAAGVTLAGIAAWYYYTQYYQEVAIETQLRPTLRPVRTAVDHAFEKKGEWVF